MVSFASPLFWQIRFLVANFNKKNFKATVHELLQLCGLYGSDARVFLLTCLISEVDPKADRHHSQKAQLIANELDRLLAAPNFSTLVCQAFEALDPETRSRSAAHAFGSGGIQVTEGYLVHLGRACKLSQSHIVSLAVGLSSSPSERTASEAVKFLKSTLSGGAPKLPRHVLHALLYLVRTDSSICGSSKTQSQILAALKSSNADLDSSVSMMPMLSGVGGGGGVTTPVAADFTQGKGGTAGGRSGASGGAGGSGRRGGGSGSGSGGPSGGDDGSGGAIVGTLPADIVGSLAVHELVRDLGYACTSSKVAFREVLASVGKGPSGSDREQDGAPLRPLTTSDVAKLLVSMASTLTGLDDDAVPSLYASFSTLMGTGAGVAASGADGGDKGRSADPAGAAWDDETRSRASWDLSVVIQVLQEDYRDLNWREVVRALDDDDVPAVPSMEAFLFIVSAFKQATGEPFPTHLLLLPWKNAMAQLAAVKYAIQCLPETLTFAHVPRMIAPVEGSPNGVGTSNQAWCAVDLYATLLRLARVGGLVSPVRALFSKAASRCPELLLLGLAQVQADALEEAERAGAGGAGSAAAAAVVYEDALRDELFAQMVRSALFSAVTSHHQPSQMQRALIARLWDVSPTLVGQVASRMFRDGVQLGAGGASDPGLITARRIIELLSPLKGALPTVLSSGNTAFAIECAVAAHTMERPVEGFSLDTFLDDLIGKLKDTAAGAIMEFIRRKAAVSSPGKRSPSAGSLAVETLVVFLMRLKAHAGLLSPSVVSQVKALYDQCAAAYPALTSASSHEIEETANEYFKKIYTSQQTIPEIIATLQRFKTSSDQSERAIFSCMIDNLFDEYRFFHKYPEKELHTTGVLFGALVEHQLVSGPKLGSALRCVLDALRKPPFAGSNGKMFRFGLYALGQFKGRLHKWPQYRSHILQIAHLRTQAAELVAEIEAQMPGGAASGGSGESGAASGAPAVGTTVPATTVAASGAATSSAPAGQAGNTTTLENGGTSAGLPSPPRPIRHSGTMPAADARMAPGSSAYSGVSGASSGVAGAAVAAGAAAMAGAAPAGHPARPVRTATATAELEAMLSGPDSAPPDEATMDRIHFIINNVTPQNVDEKLRDLNAALKPEIYIWFGNYLVVKRVATQPNFHVVYRTMLNKMGRKRLITIVLQCTVLNVRKLLASDKIKTSAQERSLLKNLGMWLGKLTVAQDKPLLLKYIDLKEMLLEAYETGRLIACVPFVAKVMEACTESRVIKPPNPWMMALMQTLRELYELPDLKLNLKFAVEVLCKALKMEVTDVAPSNLLVGRRKPVLAGNPDFNVKISEVPKVVPPADGGAAAPDAGAPEVSEGGSETVIPNLSAYVNVNASLQLFTEQPQLTRLVPVAVDRAIREIIQPVVERSVTIACITARELVMKDFALEPDNEKVLAAAKLMVTHLAGSLALVTCKEPLRVSMGNHLRTMLGGSAAADSNAVQQVVQVCTGENLELGILLIEKAATEKASRDIEDGLRETLQSRRAHFDPSGQPLWDINGYQSGKPWPAGLPEPLKPKPGGLQADQFRVYEAFSRSSRAGQPAAVAGGAAAPAAGGAGDAAAAAAGGPGPGTDNAGAISPEGSVVTPLDGIPVTLPAGVKPTLAAGQAGDRYGSALDMLLRGLRSMMQSAAAARSSPPALRSLPRDHEVVSAIREVRITRELTVPQARAESGIAVGRALFHHLIGENSEGPAMHAYVACLEIVRDGTPRLPSELTTWLAYSTLERRFNIELVVLLMRVGLLAMPELDAHLVTLMDGGRNEIAVEFAAGIVQRAVVSRLVPATDLRSTLDTLAKVARGSPAKFGRIRQLLEAVRNAIAIGPVRSPYKDPAAEGGAGGAASASDSATARPSGGPVSRTMPLVSPKEPDPPGARERVLFLLDQWMRVCADVSSGASMERYATYLNMLRQNAVLATAQAADRFFRITTELCIEAALASVAALPAREEAASAAGAGDSSAGGAAGGGEGGPDSDLDALPGGARAHTKMTYTAVDAMSKLVVLLIKYTEPAQAKVAMLNKVLTVVARVLLRDAARHSPDATARGEPGFDQRPHYRLLLDLLVDLNAPDPVLDKLNVQFLASFANILHVLQPSRVPQFAFAWLDLMAHRSLMPKLLLAKQQKGWQLVQRLVTDLLSFLYPFLRSGETNDGIRLIYKGTLRVLLVLLHDFPEFLCDYHFAFCDVIPPTCIQLRNLVLSAFPRNMRLPDPFTPNLKVDLLPEISQPPHILSDVTRALKAHGLLEDVTSYMRTRAPPAFLSGLSARLLLSPEEAVEAGTRYAVPAINGLVLYVGKQAIAQLQDEGGTSPISHSAPMDIFQQLAKDLDSEGRYYFLNAVTNQLRYPNNHTHYFSCVLLYLFAEAPNEVVQEQITRVLLERLIVHRPHPWGLLITFIELIKNPRYNFWSHGFTRCATEIERLFESVAASCMGLSSTPSAAGGEGGDRAASGPGLGSGLGGGNASPAQRSTSFSDPSGSGGPEPYGDGPART